MELSDSSSKNSLTKRQIIETVVAVFVTAYGLDLLGFFWRVRYFRFLDTLALSEEVSHVFLYLGHICFLSIMFLYAWAVKKDRPSFPFFRQQSKAPASSMTKYSASRAASWPYWSI